MHSILIITLSACLLGALPHPSVQKLGEMDNTEFAMQGCGELLFIFGTILSHFVPTE